MERRPRVVIAPGNGCRNVQKSNWYAEVARDLVATGAFSEVVLRNFPDPDVARESVWLPFLLGELKCGPDTILIGHSSGAEAALRLLESHKLLGCVLVSACHTDLGMASEAAAGYYSRPWNWAAIKDNAGFILQYHSSDDPFIPREEADFVASQIGSEYTCFDNRSHFFTHEDVAFLAGTLVARVAVMAQRGSD